MTVGQVRIAIVGLGNCASSLVQGLTHYRDAQPERDWRIPALELAFDPQTSGGLLFAVEESAADDAVDALRAAGYGRAAALGAVVPRRPDGALLAVE